MISPSYAALYDFESQIEDAFASMLLAQTTVDCYTQRSDQDLVTPRFDFQFTTGAATEHHGRAKDGSLYPDGFRGSLKVRHVTKRRDDTGYTVHRQNVAKVRRYVYQFETFITAALLPYLNVESILETGCSQGIDAQNEYDLTELSFAVAFYIKPDAWPLP